MANQMGAVTNRRLKPNYVSAINAQTPYLPQLYQQKEDKAYQEKAFGQQERSLDLSKQGLEQQNSFNIRNEALARDALDQQKKQNKTAKNLGYANMALGGVSGLASLYQGSQPLMDSIPDLSSVTQNLMPTASEMPSLFSEFSTLGEGAANIGGPATENIGEYFDFGGTSDFNVTDLVPDVVKNFGGAIWDAGSSFLSDIGDLFS